MEIHSVLSGFGGGIRSSVWKLPEDKISINARMIKFIAVKIIQYG